MVQKPKSVKYKVVAGYLLLFAIAVVSVWFVYTEISRIARPGQNERDNQQIINISNVIADLYASEALGRSAIVTGSEKDYQEYRKIIDTINTQIANIRNDVEQSQQPKFDSIRLLLNRKRRSTAEIFKSRNDFAKNNTLQRAISNIYIVKDSVRSAAPSVNLTKKYHWNTLVNSVLTPQQRDSLTKLPVSNDSLAMAFDKMLANVMAKEDKVRKQISRKEEKLLEENRIISDKLRRVLSSVEKEFLKNSYTKLKESQAAIAKTTQTMAWVGAATFLLLIIFAAVIIRDLTSQQNYRRQLEILNHENEELLRSKSMLMATVTHDLQTPLGSIFGFHDLIKESGVSLRQDQYLNNIRESAGYIQKLVNDLLDFSKLENNKITIQKTPFNAKQLVESTCMALEPIAINKDIELNWDIDESLNAGFISDPYRIKQVLTNLVSNAVKFTSEGSVEVTGRLEGGSIVLSVLDTGIGIARQSHADVFREFTQAHSGIEKKFGGTGLGLNISKRIIELLDGTIELESEEGQGSIFTIALPAIAAPDSVLAAPEEKDDLTGGLTGKRILVIDDDSVQLTLMTELFANYPVIVNTEINSSSVLPLLEHKKFDIVLTDIQMPVLDGFGLIELIRNHHNPIIATIPVIALSGKRDLSATDFTDKGFTAHHPKPIQLEGLLGQIIALLKGRPDSFAGQRAIAGLAGAPLYNLKSLAGFTNNDPESLRAILQTFITSAHDNCSVMQAAVNERNENLMAETAHKMIPMLRQMEIHSIADLLVPLEDRSLKMEWHEMQEYIDAICKRMTELIRQLQAEVD